MWYLHSRRVYFRLSNSFNEVAFRVTLISSRIGDFLFSPSKYQTSGVLQLLHSSGGEFDNHVPVTPSEGGWRPHLKLNELLQRRAYVIRMPTILPQAADAKRDKAKAGRIGA